MSVQRANPYVVGQWVRGDKFYGRTQLIDEILTGPRNSLWVLGTRRVGKTSLLKQLELLTSSVEHHYLPIFWDLQGADSPEELHLSFEDALLDGEERLAAAAIELSKIRTDDLFVAMGALRRALRAQERSLLLLCDEVEELLHLHRQAPSLLRKLRHAMQSHDGVRSVLTSSVRLCALAEQRDDTSPFLHGFSPPLYIGRLQSDEALALARQDRAPSGWSPELADDVALELCRRCDHHPYLIQLVGKRLLELGDLDEACRQVANDRMTNYFFSVDFEMLTAIEQAVLRLISEQGSATESSIDPLMKGSSADRADALQRLENLGFIRRNESLEYVLPSYFLRLWLEELAIPEPGPAPLLDSRAETAVVRTVDDRYTLHEQIGSGATGRVFKARDTLLDTWVALKLLHPEYAANREALERARQEILLSRDLAHPNIVRIYHLASSDSGTYLTMQWIPGGTLGDIIAERAPLPTPELLGLAIKLSSALAAAHGRGILHRDLKPSNVLVDSDGEPHLADFGLARLIGALGVTHDGVFVGTPHYASPEQVRLLELDARSDVYALGLVLFEMATGQRPFIAETASELLALHRSAPEPDPRSLNPDLPTELGDLILRCLAKDPDQRLASAHEAEQALRHIAEGGVTEGGAGGPNRTGGQKL